MKKFKEYEDFIDENLDNFKNNKLGNFIDSQRSNLQKKMNTENIVQHLDESIKIKEEKVSIINNNVLENIEANIYKLESSKKELELLIVKIKEEIESVNNYYKNEVLKDFDKILLYLEDESNKYFYAYDELLKLKQYLNKSIEFFDVLSREFLVLIDKNNYDNTFVDFEKFTNQYHDFTKFKCEKLKRIDLDFYNIYIGKIFSLVDNMKDIIKIYYSDLCEKIKDYYTTILNNQMENLKNNINEKIHLKKEVLLNLEQVDKIINGLEDIVILYNIEINKLSSSINESKKFLKYIKIEIINDIEKEQSALFDKIKNFKNNVFNNYIIKIKSNLENYIVRKSKLLDEYISGINENNVIDKYNNIKNYYENISKDLEKTIIEIKNEINILESFENKYKLGNIKPDIQFKTFKQQLFDKYKENYEIILRKLINITLKKLESDFVILGKKKKKDYILKYIKDVKETIDKYNSEFSLNYKYSYYFDNKNKLEELVNDYLNDVIYFYLEKLKNQKDAYQMDLNSKKDSNNLFDLIKALKLYKSYSKNLVDLKGDYDKKIKGFINEIKKEVKGFDIKIIKNKLSIDLTLDISEIINKIKSLLPIKENELNQKIDKIYNSKIEEINNIKTINARKISNLIDDYYKQYNEIKYEFDNILKKVKNFVYFRPNLKYHSIEDYIKNHIKNLLKDTIQRIEHYHNEYKALLKAILFKDFEKIKEIEYGYADLSIKIEEYMNYDKEISKINKKIKSKLKIPKLKYLYKTAYGLKIAHKIKIENKNFLSRIFGIIKIMLYGGKNDSNNIDNMDN
ncbi:hypothetical protein [Marinitoga aeolica]|uniref:Uncharacterized protein n=1 Tax=Marinitoga aeolica TaxID=2809031 RepID=A0ABY8PRD1_9BACT|nr:hypothetical protein [Marinitoga aeolica]WGS65171.1 hypothetical protein JRV97_01035 [Marinitoga aeolica]